MLEKFIKLLVEKLGMSRHDAVLTGIFALGGFWIDAAFLPGGIPPGTMTLLFGSAGYLASKVVMSIPRYQNYILRTIDRKVEEGHMTEEQGQKYKNELLQYWYGKSKDQNDPSDTEGSSLNP